MKRKKVKNKIISSSIIFGSALLLSACNNEPQMMYGAAIPTENVVNEEDVIVTTMYGVKSPQIEEETNLEDLPVLMYGVPSSDEESAIDLEEETLYNNSISQNETK